MKLLAILLLAGCGAEVAPAACNIDGVAYQDGARDPTAPGYGPLGVGARYCDVGFSRKAWSCYPNGYETTDCAPISVK